MNCKIKMKHNYKKIECIPQKIINKTTEGIEEILKNIRGYAIRLERGHNSSGILLEMVDVTTKQVKGKVYADPNKFMTDSNISYLWFEYFGTGTFAEMGHIGKTKHFIETNYEEWYIPVHKAGRKLNYPIITINNNQFYVAHGSKANHFITDAEFKSRNENIKIMDKKIKEIIEEVCK